MLWWNALLRADTTAGARRSDPGMAAVKIDRSKVEAMACRGLAWCIRRASVPPSVLLEKVIEKCWAHATTPCCAGGAYTPVLTAPDSVARHTQRYQFIEFRARVESQRPERNPIGSDASEVGLRRA